MNKYKISNLQVSNFRNLSSQVITFGENINCIFGKNGNGKTNILEALYILGNRKSFRKNTGFPQYLCLDCEDVEILFSSTLLDGDENKVSYSGKMNQINSQWYLDGRPVKKKIPLKLVLVNPFDSHDFHGHASSRRQFFDHYIGLIDKSYSSVLRRYQTALRFRNSLLSKKPSQYIEQIRAADGQFIQLSLEITRMRQKFLSEVVGP